MYLASVVVEANANTGDSTNYVGEIPRRDDRWRHHISPNPQFRHGTEGEGNILQSPTLVIQPTRLSDLLTSMYSVCTMSAFGGIEPRPSGLKFDALTTRLPTAHLVSVSN
ncbi:hypothetical protein TNCV_2336431 [Trichonephila clavipes]|uniref:Uncharacterized protein n=1 Tax=Trichonephila clavipes TaxID=2585209 RepID=A0A8X6SGR3_TRICX|nr:hypothetical protein TNCV_2336431 [Trichonephila clavipes]